MFVAVVGSLFYLLGYVHSYKDNITNVIEEHNIPKQCIASHNYCVTMKALVSRHKIKADNCLSQLKEASKPTEEKEE